MVRVDGVNERNHAGSFAHKEVHKEKRVRRATGLDRRNQGRKPVPPRPNASRPGPPQMPPRTQRRTKLADSVLLRVILWIIGLFFFVSFVIPFLFALL